MTLSTPQQTNYGLRGFLMLFHEPVMHLNEEEQIACRRHFEAFERRYRFREHRTLDYYADRRCITTKYLSEVVRKTTGVTANHWINMVASLDIARQLRNPSLSISDIAYRFHFSSPSYFGRYVQKYLGTTPTEFRGRKR